MNINPADLGLNVIDVLMAVVVASVICLGRKDGIVAELFKLFGVFFTMFLTLHYYVRFADLLQKIFFGKDTETEVFSFALLGTLIFFTFVIITKGWDLIIKIRSFDILDRWGNPILSLVRSYFICSMIFFALIMTDGVYFAPRAKKSISWTLFRRPAVEFYRVTYKGLIEKLFPGEKINKNVFEVIEDTSPWKSDEKKLKLDRREGLF